MIPPWPCWYVMDNLHWQATDVGDSMVVHAFGAYFGLVVSWIVYKKDVKDAEEKEASVYQSDLFAMIGSWKVTLHLTL